MSDIEKKKRPRQQKTRHEQVEKESAKVVRDGALFAIAMFPSVSKINMTNVFKKHEVTTTFINSNVFHAKYKQEEPKTVVTIQFDPKIVKKRKKKKEDQEEEEEEDQKEQKQGEPLTVEIVRGQELTYLINGDDLDTEDGFNTMYTFITKNDADDMFANVKMNTVNSVISMDDVKAFMRSEIINDIKSELRKYTKLVYIAETKHLGTVNHIVDIDYIF